MCAGDSAPAKFIIRPSAKQHRNIQRSTREQTLFAFPALLTRRSPYFSALLDGEFREASRQEHDERARSTGAGRIDGFGEEVEGDLIEELQDYFSDSDGSYHDGEDDEIEEDFHEVSAVQSSNTAAIC